jgi:hypothetical protein
MQVPAALSAFAILALSASSGAAAAQNGNAPGASSASHCPRTASYLTDTSGPYRGQPLRPRKLTELPPATAYMAVYRHIGLCEVPLTMADYRNPRR